MLKVLKNLKESWPAVLVIVILLCVQATVDLALPDYTCWNSIRRNRK